jgi:ubiquinone/menaquinone biosynthesis C-methylase UbiE
LGVYHRCMLPWLLDLGMRQSQLARLREQLVVAARGRVLEIGIGSGLNIPFYPRTIEVLIGVEPSREMLAKAHRHAAWVHFPVQLMEGEAENLPLEDCSIDSVVTTWTLCSVRDPMAALRQIRRVLRPGGRLIFIEHGLAPEAGVRRWQERITPLWRRIAGGCHLNRPIDDLIGQSGLRLAEIETGYLVRGPRPFTFHYRGQALP